MPEGKTDEIDRLIENGMKVGLLVEQGSESASHREFSADELYALVKRLKENGGVQTAYLCARRLVELNPAHSDAWYDLGDFGDCVGLRVEACASFLKYFYANPDDGEIEHLLIALRDDAPPPRASDRTIQHNYKTFAKSYETRMLDDLKNQGPERIIALIKSVNGEKEGLDVLDLGCGSGLSGKALKPFAARLTGIDLSPEMLELARKRNIYDRLEVSEITDWLERSEQRFDLITSLDCLIYFADLGPITAAAAKRLNPGGVFALSMERGARYPFHLSDTGRYTHHPDHVREVAAKAGLNVAGIEEGFLRYEYGEEVIGLFAVLCPGARA